MGAHMLFWLGCAVPMLIVCTWWTRSRSRQVDAIRRQDPRLASELEQSYYARSNARLPVRDRAFEKPRRS